MVKNLIFICSLLCNGMAFCQSSDSTAFHNMLDTLLGHTVTEIRVKNIDTTDHTLLFVDTRELYEYETSHIENAIWVGYDNFNIGRFDAINKNTPIILYCSVGYRSEKITEKLLESGYTNVSNLYGGIFEWTNKGMPVYDGTNNITKKVHTYNKEWSQWLVYSVKVY